MQIDNESEKRYIHGRYPDFKLPIFGNSRLSFSQNWEDAYLLRSLDHIKQGFYVDVGAYHPIYDSVTKLFYDRGWRGINIEPGSSFVEFEKHRKNDVNLRLAISDEDGEAEFHEILEAPGASYIDTFSTPEMRELKSNTRIVAKRRLENILEEYASDLEIHFLKIDVEGAERSVLLSSNWKRFRPWIIVVEATIPGKNNLSNENWEEILINNGYLNYFFDGLNMYYVDSNKKDIVFGHDQPINIFDRFDKYNYQQFLLDERMRKIEEILFDITEEKNINSDLKLLLLDSFKNIGEFNDDKVLHLKSLISAALSNNNYIDNLFLEAQNKEFRNLLNIYSKEIKRFNILLKYYKLNRAPGELSFGLFVARRLRGMDAAIARLFGRKNLFFKRPHPNFFPAGPNLNQFRNLFENDATQE